MEYLSEIFDSKLPLTRDEGMENVVRAHYERKSSDSIGSIYAHRIGDGEYGHLIHLVRNGKHELHHIDSAYESGIRKRINKKTAIKWAGTFMHYAHDHIISKGKDLKILSGSKELHDGFSPIVHHYANKNDCDVEHGKEMVNGTDMWKTVISKKKRNSPMFEGFKEFYLHNINK